MKKIKHFTKTMVLLISNICLCSCMGRGPAPVDVVMVDNELFFVLEKKWEISSVCVDTRNPKAGEVGEKDWKTVWALNHNPATTEAELKKWKYPKMRQIKYGQKIEELPMVTGPFELQKNVEYLVRIDLRKKIARETFIITDENKAVMPKPRFPRQKGRTYSVSIDKDGNKILIPKPVPK
ncbi:MAG: hypothetical protein HY796_08120 [Elusimicrobia bacterium]|nr:hypothetical protein [Elusimicrobiota bacterium]